jgi:hypothetical protein
VAADTVCGFRYRVALEHFAYDSVSLVDPSGERQIVKFFAQQAAFGTAQSSQPDRSCHPASSSREQDNRF